MPAGFAAREPTRTRAVADYIAGMTDRFAAREHERLTGLRLLTAESVKHIAAEPAVPRLESIGMSFLDQLKSQAKALQSERTAAGHAGWKRAPPQTEAGVPAWCTGTCRTWRAS